MNYYEPYGSLACWIRSRQSVKMSFAALFARVRKQGSAAWFGSGLAGGAVVLLLRRRGEKNKAIAPPRPLKPSEVCGPPPAGEPALRVRARRRAARRPRGRGHRGGRARDRAGAHRAARDERHARAASERGAPPPSGPVRFEFTTWAEYTAEIRARRRR